MAESKKERVPRRLAGGEIWLLVSPFAVTAFFALVAVSLPAVPIVEAFFRGLPLLFLALTLYVAVERWASRALGKLEQERSDSLGDH